MTGFSSETGLKLGITGNFEAILKG